MVGILSGCGNGDSTERFDGPTMGSSYSIQYVRHAGLPAPAEVRVEVEKILSDVDRQMSTYRSDSDIERFNNLPANHCQTMPAPILELVRVGERLSLQSDGSYDLTVEPLLNLWGFGPQAREEKVPSAEALAEVQQRVGHNHLRIEGDQLCKDAAVEVDFNSIAAGYAVDTIAAELEALGIHDYLAEATGELKAVGKKLDGSPWRIAPKNPVMISKWPSASLPSTATACPPPVTTVTISSRVADAFPTPSMPAPEHRSYTPWPQSR